MQSCKVLLAALKPPLLNMPRLGGLRHARHMKRTGPQEPHKSKQEPPHPGGHTTPTSVALAASTSASSASAPTMAARTWACAGGVWVSYSGLCTRAWA